MIMNRQMKKYKESFSGTPESIMPSQASKVKLDMRGLVKFDEEIRRYKLRSSSGLLWTEIVY